MAADKTQTASAVAAPPKNNLVRLLVPGDGIGPGLELREASGAKGAETAPVMFGEFAVYNRWTEIDSFFEGQFLERFVKGSFKRTFIDDADRIRSIFQHGRDPQIGMKPLGPVDTLREQDTGAYYEVPLLDAPYARETLLPGLRANLYGASFKFRVMREEIVENPGVSDYNPKGIAERTVKEARLYEFGPVTFPAYPDASAGVRSGTDDYFLEGLQQGDPDCLRAAAEFGGGRGAASPFSVFIAERLGVDLARNGNGATAPETPESTPPAAAPAAAERMDSEDVGTLACMLDLASQYIGDQDEETPAEAAAITAMQGIQAELIKLLNVEAVEDEPDEPEDEPEGEASTHVGDGASERGEQQADGSAPEKHQSADTSTTPAAQDPAVRGTTPLLGPEKELWRL